MTYVYLLARFYPVISIACILICAELAIFYRRRGSVWGLSMTGLAAMFFLVTASLWILNRGDRNSDAWVTEFVEGAQVINN